jgi:hypothetical protein
MGKMTNNYKILVIPILFLCCPLEGVPGDSNFDYYPLEDGLKWVYHVKENENEYDQEVKCYRPSQAQTNNFILETKGKRSLKYFFRTDSSGIYLYKINTKLLGAPFSVDLKFDEENPVFSCTKEQWNYVGNISWLIFNKPVIAHYNFEAEETIETCLGSFSCLKLSTHLEVDGKISKINCWYATGKGLIKVEGKDYSKILCKFYLDKEY